MDLGSSPESRIFGKAYLNYPLFQRGALRPSTIRDRTADRVPCACCYRLSSGIPGQKRPVRFQVAQTLTPDQIVKDVPEVTKVKLACQTLASRESGRSVVLITLPDWREPCQKSRVSDAGPAPKPRAHRQYFEPNMARATSKRTSADPCKFHVCQQRWKIGSSAVTSARGDLSGRNISANLSGHERYVDCSQD